MREMGADRFAKQIAEGKLKAIELASSLDRYWFAPVEEAQEDDVMRFTLRLEDDAPPHTDYGPGFRR